MTSPMDLTALEAAFRSVWKRLGPHAAKVLGSEVELGPPSIGHERQVGDPGFCATIHEGKDESGPALIVFDRAAAIAASGVMVMIPPSAIAEKIESAEVSEEDGDALGECVNQLLTVFNEVLDAELESPPHLVFSQPAPTDAPGTTDVVVIGGSIKIGEQFSGVLEIVLPAALFGVALPDAQEPTAGIELSPEELEAVRSAARSLSAGVAMFLVPLERVRSDWDAVLDGGSLEFEYVATAQAVASAVREGRCNAVVVDADACAAGGLPALAILRTGGSSVRTLIAASSPTRSHLIACMAAGCTGYLHKPVDIDTLMAELSGHAVA